MKLTKILQEIEIQKFEKAYTLNPNPSRLKNPTKKDTMASWLDRNNLSYDVDKYKLIQYRVNCSVNIDIKCEVDWKKLQLITNDDVHNKEKYNKFINRPAAGEFQAYFNRVCGEGRVKVWIDGRPPLRVIINVASPEEFKMIL